MSGHFFFFFMLEAAHAYLSRIESMHTSPCVCASLFVTHQSTVASNIESTITRLRRQHSSKLMFLAEKHSDTRQIISLPRHL